MSHTSGNPRITPPSELNVICEIDGKEMPVSIIKDIRIAILPQLNERRTARQGPLKIFQFTQKRIDAIESTMPATIKIELNPNYGKKVDDFVSTPYRVLQAEIDSWVNRIIPLI